jgi:hypothetical protein
VTALRPLIAMVICLISVSARGLESPTREFAADIVSRDSSGDAPVTVARLYAARGKVRIEAGDLPDGFFLIDHDAPSALLVRPGQRVYMNARQSSPLTQIFVPVDATDPCRQWRLALDDAGAGTGAEHWRCDVPENPAKDARNTREFRIVSADQTAQQRFIDSQLQFPVKVISADGSSLTLEHILVAPQPAGLFTVPSDYHAFDPRALVERIKHSDVWAAPPAP